MDGEAKALRENEDVKEFYLGVAEGKRKIVPRRASTTSGASAGWRSCIPLSRDPASACTTADDGSRHDPGMTARHDEPLRRARNPRSRPARARSSTCCPISSATRWQAPGWARAARGRRSAVRHLARGAGQAAAAAQVRSADAAEASTRRSAASTSRRRARPSALLMSPGPIFEPEGHGADFGGAGARAVRRRLPPGRHRAQLVLLSSDARRLHPGGRRACARLRRHSRRHRQHRAAARRHRALQAERLLGTPDFLKILLDTAAKDRQGRVLDQARRWSPARRCRPRCARSSPRAASTVLQCYAIAETGVISYESDALRGHDRQRGRSILEIVRPGTGDPVADGEVGEVVVTSFNPRLSDDPARHRRSVRGAGRRLARAAAPTCASRAGWAAPTRPPRSRACSCIPRRSPRSPSAIRSSAACGSSSAARPSRTP